MLNRLPTGLDSGHANQKTYRAGELGSPVHFLPPHRYQHADRIGKACHQVWLGLANRNSIPESGLPSGEEGLPKAHPDLAQKIVRLTTLPNWKTAPRAPDKASPAAGKASNPPKNTQFSAGKVKSDFAHDLRTARLLLDELHSQWGDTQPLTMLQLAGPDAVQKAHDEADDVSLELCSISWSLACADEAIRSRLGPLVEDQAPVGDALASMHIITPDILRKFKGIVPQMGSPEPPPNFVSRHTQTGKPILWLNAQHPNWRADSLLIETAKLYLNPMFAITLSPAKISEAMQEPLSPRHLEMRFTLTEGAALHLAKQIHSEATHNPWPLSTAKCLGAYEQACRKFGEKEVQSVLFTPEIINGIVDYQGNTPKPALTLKILMVAVDRFLDGREEGWH